ncbi:hypothetical protein [Paenibacillus wynnii]|nr:hypothetical protein [Paenibacillus wynnii]
MLAEALIHAGYSGVQRVSSAAEAIHINKCLKAEGNLRLKAFKRKRTLRS